MALDLHSKWNRFRQRLLQRWVVTPLDLDTHSQQTSGSRQLQSRFLQQPRRISPVQSPQRERLLHWLLGLAACAIVLRLVHLQVICQDHFSQRALRQQINEEPMLARPGDLFDRNGRLLATTITVPSLYLCPARIKEIPQCAALLAQALQLDEQQLVARISQNSKKQFLWVKRRLTDEEAQAVKDLKLPTKYAGFRREFQRHYPQGELAAHVLGIRNIDGIGQGGMEESLDSTLKGRDGVRRYVRDARGYVMDVLEDVTEPPEDGASVQLTIDIVLQLYAERQLDALMEKHRAKGACAIVMHPQTGEILALAARPTFNPNRPELADAAAWRNMATSAVFEPGSTFKPMVVAWGLDRGVIGREDVFDCGWGAYRMGRRILHDHHRYGELSLTDVLVKSSNIGMAKIGEKLGNEQLYALATAFGFGRRTGIELPGELPGLLRPLQKWTSYSTGSIPMGQELAATPLQMIAAHATLANRGISVSPHLVLRTSGIDQHARQVLVSRIVSDDSASWLVQGPMVEVVHRGTGMQARLPEIEVFGKTGTAQKQEIDGPGYSSTRHLSSFIGGASAGDPQLVVLISVDEPRGAEQYGGSVAAPYVAAILQQGLPIAQQTSDSSPVKLTRELQQIEAPAEPKSF